MPHAACPPTELRAHVRAHAEDRPGVYRIFGSDDELIYVGKSVRLRTRLLSYFRASKNDKPYRIMREAQRIAWEHIPDEFGALVREMRLIQRHNPRFNVRHRRRGTFAFIVLTHEIAPRLRVVRQLRNDGCEVFGPLPDSEPLRSAVRDLAHEAGLRDCPSSTAMHFADQLDIFGLQQNVRSPGCIRAELDSCSAPCCGRITALDYARRVGQARALITGSDDRVLEQLHARMRTAAAAEQFEYAAALRDRLERLQWLKHRISTFRTELASLDFVYRARARRGRSRLYLIRQGRVCAQLPWPRSTQGRDRARRQIEYVYASPLPNTTQLSAEDAAEMMLVAHWFRIHPEERQHTRPPSWFRGSRRPSSAPARTRPGARAERKGASC